MCHSESTDQGPERWCKGGVFKLNWGGGGELNDVPGFHLKSILKVIN